MYHPVITVFACVYQAKKYAYPPDVTKHFESISNPHTNINIKKVTCYQVQSTMQLRAINLSSAVARTTNSYIKTIQAVTQTNRKI